MHVALIISEERLLHEHFMLNRLAIGLMSEGLRVTRIVPESLAWEHVRLGEKRIALTPCFEVDMKVLPWMRKSRTSQLASEMEKSPPDAIYVIGEPCWRVGHELSEALEKPLLLDVWNARMARRVPKGHLARHVAAYVTPTREMNRLLGQTVDPGLICTVPMGIALPTTSRKILSNPKQSISMAIVGGGRDVPAYRAMLGGIRRISKNLPQLQVFLELRGPNQHEIWRYARKLKLLDCISTITEASPYRRLLTQCDMMLLPERFGELYTIMLEAMANGMVIVANQDPMLEMLHDEENAYLVDAEHTDHWSQALLKAIRNPESARELGKKACLFASEHHSTNVQVESLITLLERVSMGGSYSFLQAANEAS